MKEIIIDFFPDGTSKVEAVGFDGSTCMEATDFLKVLGSVQAHDPKPEYYNQIRSDEYAQTGR